MKAIATVLLVIIICGTGLDFIGAEQICAIKTREIPSESESQNSVDDNEDTFNANNNSQSGNEVKFEKCNESCYTLWQEETTSNGSKINIFLQGCWKDESHHCENSECIAYRSANALSGTKFCCCKADYCNVNVTDPVENKLLITSPATNEYLEQVDSEHWMLVTLTSLICILLVTFTLGLLIYQICRNNVSLSLGKPLPYNDNFNDGNGLKTGTYTFDHLKISTLVGQGRYGSVWQGSMGDQEVAVKIFPDHYQSYFLNERDIYCLPFMEHPSLLHYYGSDERVSMEGNNEYLLVLSYAPGGTLNEFLRYHTFDWMTFCKMGLSIIKGLAHLHTDIRKGDKFKPCIAHRDMNSRNILIKADGTCCICDLGLAVQISGSKYYSHGEEQHAETKSINDVGTLQYMAPEVLEGAVNLRDCESSLKQIDVYAMGLILWELVSRCSDVYVPGSEVPPYRQPFEKEIGLHPTFEQIKVLVSRNKARPILEGNLVDKPGVRLIRETMEDCWDSDAEARLTALCIEERLMELKSHRITMYFTDGSPMVNSHCGFVPSTTNSLYDTHNDGSHVVQINDCDSNDAVVDNLVHISPTESSGTHEHSAPKNSNEAASLTCNTVLNHRPQPQLQPYQGRNPCMERNLMIQSDSSEELGCHGNILVNKSLKHSLEYAKLSSSETQSLVPHDYLLQQQQGSGQQHLGQNQFGMNASMTMRPVTPIPYVQNVISECSGGTTSYNKLKQTNVQESCYTALPTSSTNTSPRRCRFSGWTNLKKIIANKRLAYHQSQPGYTKCQIEREDSKSNLLSSKNANHNQQPKIVETNVSIAAGGKYVNGVVSEKNRDRNDEPGSSRPLTLPLVNLKVKNSDPPESLSNLRSPSSTRRDKGAVARFSLYDDRMMGNALSEEEAEDNRNHSKRNENGGLSSSSVPFGMDFVDEHSTDARAKLDTKNVTCF